MCNLQKAKFLGPNPSCLQTNMPEVFLALWASIELSVIHVQLCIYIQRHMLAMQLINPQGYHQYT